jgi:UDP-N-acetylglucosamine 2-epimerase
MSESNHEKRVTVLDQPAHGLLVFHAVGLTHPQTRKRLDQTQQTLAIDEVQFMPYFAFTDYVRLQIDAARMLSERRRNSGTIAEEASRLGLTTMNLRWAHERPEAVEEGTTMLCDLIPEPILVVRFRHLAPIFACPRPNVEISRTTRNDKFLVAFLNLTFVRRDCGIGNTNVKFTPREAVRSARAAAPPFISKPVADYAGGFVSEKVLRIVLGHTDFVNQIVWRK